MSRLYKIEFTDEEGGFFTNYHCVNCFIYSRADEANAFEYSEEVAIEIIQEANDLGYDCKAVPSINTTY